MTIENFAARGSHIIFRMTFIRQTISYTCPKTFTADVKKAGDLQKVIDEIVAEIRNLPGRERPFGNGTDKIFLASARIPYSNAEFDDESKICVFILLEEDHSRSRWSEAIYAFRIDDGRITGCLVDFGEASHSSEGDEGDHYRFILRSVQGDMIEYEHMIRSNFKNFPGWLGKGHFKSKSTSTKTVSFEEILTERIKEVESSENFWKEADKGGD